MGTMIRAELSEKNKYWISKHRYYELKHFCLQYKAWKQAYLELTDVGTQRSVLDGMPSAEGMTADLTARCAVKRAYYAEHIELIERIAREADAVLCPYILKAVTEDISYTCLKMTFHMPCGRDMYYDRYRKFFWLLSNARN